MGAIFFFKQLKGGVTFFLGFVRGLVCAFANRINFKDPDGEDRQPS